MKSSSELGMERNVMIVTPLPKKEIYNDMYSESVTADRIIEGNDSLAGKDIMLYNNSRGFYYEDTDKYKRRVARLPGFGYSEEEYPEYYAHSVQYRNILNLVKPEHKYLICVDSYKADNERLYFILRISVF